MLIYLVGFMGSGKTTHGKALAKLLDFDFTDMDDAVQKSASISIPELFSLPEGESQFRKLESEWLKKETLNLKNTVIATGGGTPCYFDNMQYMNQSGITVYLQLHPASLFHRLAPHKTKRPLIARFSDTELMDFIHSKLLEREHFYNRAHMVAKGENLNVKLLASEIKLHPLFSDKQQARKS